MPPCTSLRDERGRRSTRPLRDLRPGESDRPSSCARSSSAMRARNEDDPERHDERHRPRDARDRRHVRNASAARRRDRASERRRANTPTGTTGEREHREQREMDRRVRVVADPACTSRRGPGESHAARRRRCPIRRDAGSPQPIPTTWRIATTTRIHAIGERTSERTSSRETYARRAKRHKRISAGGRALTPELESSEPTRLLPRGSDSAARATVS